MSTAFHLMRKGYGRVTLIEKGVLGDGSSSRAAGIITGLLLTRTSVLVRKLCLELFRQLSEELEGYEYNPVGCLNLFTPRSWMEREGLLEMYRELEAPFEVLDSVEMKKRWPMLQPRGDSVGLLDPLGGYSEPHEYVPALAARIRRMGVEVQEREMVKEIVTSGGRVTGVATSNGFLEADTVVGAVDCWTHRLLSDLGLTLPVKSFVHQRYLTQPLSSPVVFPVVNAHPLDGYVRPASGGRLLLGISPLERPEYQVDSPDFQMSALSAAPELKDRVRRNFGAFIPVLKGLPWESESVGLLTIPMDGEPLLGPLKELPGFFVGLAFQGSGFAYNPGAGLLLAEFIADGHSSIDISAFSPSRFDPADSETYLATRLTEGQLGLPIRRH